MTLVREPDNPHDPNAVAVYDATGKHLTAYINKQRARQMAVLLDTGERLKAISIRATHSGHDCEAVAIVAAFPYVLAHLRSPRPEGAPLPAHLH